MRMDSIFIHGDLENAIEYINQYSLSIVVMQIISKPLGHHIILKFDSYSRYTHFANKLGWEVMSAKEYFGE